MEYFDGLQFAFWASLPEYRDSLAKEFSPELSSDWYAIQFHYSGTLRYAFGHRKVAVERGSCAWISVPRQGFKYRYGPPRGESRSHHYVAFMGPRTEKYVEAGLLPVNPPLKPTLITRPDHFLDQMRDLHLLIERHAVEQAVNRLEGLLVDMQFQPSSPGGGVVPKIEHLAHEIREHPERDWDFAEEAERLGISQAHFRRVFPEVMRRPPAKYLKLARLAMSQVLLRDTDHPVARVAEAVGIPNLQYFTRIFTERYKMPPARYRQQAIETRDG